MRMLHALLAGPVVALALGAAPTAAATTLPTAEEAQRLVTQAVNARAVTTVVCTDNRKNAPAKGIVDYIGSIRIGAVTSDGSQFLLSGAGERFVAKLQSDWEHDRAAFDSQKTAWPAMVAAPAGCRRLPLGLYTVNSVSNVRAGESDQTALADYTFTVAPNTFGQTLISNKYDPMVESDSLVGVPARPVYLSFYVDNAKKPLAAPAKLEFADGSWHVVP